MQLDDPKEAETKVAGRYQVLLILWIAMLTSFSIFLVMTFVIPSSAPPNLTLTFVLLALSLVAVIVSVLLKSYFLKQAIEKQQLPFLMNAYVTGFALSEAAAILGLLDHMATNSRYFSIAFIMSAIGLLLHFPRKEHIRASSYKQF